MTDEHFNREFSIDVSEIFELERSVIELNLGLLARFEKAAALQGNKWTYWDICSAPEELAQLKAQSLPPRIVEQRRNKWIAKNEASFTDLIREILNNTSDNLVNRIREMIENGADPNEASLLKDTPLGCARKRHHHDVFDLLIEMGAEGEKAGFGKLHHAARYGTPEDIRRELPNADPVKTYDSFDSYVECPSPLAEAVISGKVENLSTLLDAIEENGNINDGEVERCFAEAVKSQNAELVKIFLQKQNKNLDQYLKATVKSYDVNMLKMLLENGADVRQVTDLCYYSDSPYSKLDANGEPLIRAYIDTLLECGWKVEYLEERDQDRYVTGAYLIPRQDMSAPDFTDPARQCTGNANPEERNTPYYYEMLRTGQSSFSARRWLGELPEKAWTADRFGQTTTALPDGSWVQIGGEHGNSYDPDFMIFSDVILLTPKKLPRVFFYPPTVFPPTDAHSATLIGESIWIIGNLGCPSHRQPHQTPVFRLDLSDFSMHQMTTTGDLPGWISGHTATEENGMITIAGGKVYDQSLEKNTATFTLDTRNLAWVRNS